MSIKEDEEAKFAFDNMIQAAETVAGVIFMTIRRTEPERARKLHEFIKSENPNLVLQVHSDGLDLFAFDKEKQQLGGPVFSYLKSDENKRSKCTN